jgi:hypothetical protein
MESTLSKVIESGASKVAIYFDEFKGESVLHVRKCYTNKAGELGRTSKGVMLTPSAATALFTALGEVLAAGPGSPSPFPDSTASPKA